MIYLYYTGAEFFESAQTEAYKSLGGYISSTRVPNSTLNSLFRDVSEFSKSKNTPEIICIAIKNHHWESLSNFTFFINNVSEDVEFLAAFVKPNKDDCGNLFFEQIKTQEHLPYYASFEKVTGADNSISISEFEANSYIGLFLQKKNNCGPCGAIDLEKSTIESIDLNFSWQ